MAAPVERMPWEHDTPASCRVAAERWLKEQGRSVARVYAVEWWAVFYVSTAGEARHQRWELDPNQKLVLAGPHQSGWPVPA